MIRLLAKVIFFFTSVGVCFADTYHLSGLISTENTNGVAMFRSANKVLVAKQGDVIFKGLTLKRVGLKHVIVTKESVDYRFALYQDIFPSVSDNFQLMEGWQKQGDTIYFTEKLSKHLKEESLMDLVMAVTADAYKEGGEVVGFKLHNMDSGSFYDLIGIENGDVITHVNGISLDGVLKAINTLRHVREEKNISISLLRSGYRKDLRLVVQ